MKRIVMRANTSVLGRFGAAIFGLFFAGLGVLFLVVGSNSLLKEAASSGWPQVDCQIRSVELLPSTRTDGGFEATIQFDGRSAGRPFTGSHVERDTDYATLQAFADRFPVGSPAKAHVDPANSAAPRLAVGARGPGSLGMVLLLLIPLAFVFIGLGILVAAWRRKGGPERSDRPISDTLGTRRLRQASKGLSLVIGLAFTLIGGGMSWWTLVKPGLKVADARSWTEVPGVVEFSRVVSIRGNKGSRTYRPEILFRYEVGGRTYRSSAVTFFSGSSSGLESKKQLVDRHPAGARVVCWVNPQNPADAVLNRDFSALAWLGVLALVFFLIGVAVLSGTLTKGRRTEVLRPVAEASVSQTLSLRAASTPLGRVFIALAVALFWNGIISIFIGLFIKGWNQGRTDWGLALFLIPFAVIGLALLGWLVRETLALANPRPSLQLSPGRLVSGQRVRVRWSFSGAVDRLDHLKITLMGRESAVRRRGKHTQTETSVFKRIILADTAERVRFREGETEISLPLDAPPSFEAEGQKLEWLIQVEGRIARWPDVQVDFPVTLESGAGALDVTPTPSGVVAEGGAPEWIEKDGFRLGVKGRRIHFRPGEVLEGAAAWALDAPPERVEVRLFWYAGDLSNPEVHRVAEETFEGLQAREVRSFRFSLPTGPVSLQGQLISLRWGLELIARRSSTTVLRWDLLMSHAENPLFLSRE
jgi:hypothetical protein